MVPPCFSLRVATGGLMSRQISAVRITVPAVRRLRPARAGSSGAMFAKPAAAGSHPPGSLKAPALCYSFLHRFFRYHLHYIEIPAPCQDKFENPRAVWRAASCRATGLHGRERSSRATNHSSKAANRKSRGCGGAAPATPKPPSPRRRGPNEERRQWRQKRRARPMSKGVWGRQRTDDHCELRIRTRSGASGAKSDERGQ